MKHRFATVTVSALFIISAIALPGYSEQVPMDKKASTLAEKKGMPAGDPGMDEEEVAHPFLTHMGVPEGVGVYNLRLAGLATRADGATKGDFAFHFETGLTKFIGLHVRNDGFLTNTRTEAMFQFAAVRSKNGMNGFSPLIEFEFPTRSGASNRVNTLVGFSTALANSRAAFNQVVHYNPREEMVDASAAVVFKAGAGYYPVVEVLTEAGRGERPLLNILLGLKFRVSERTIVGVALMGPATGRRDFSSQLILQPDFEWRRARGN